MILSYSDIACGFSTKNSLTMHCGSLSLPNEAYVHGWQNLSGRQQKRSSSHQTVNFHLYMYYSVTMGQMCRNEILTTRQIVSIFQNQRLSLQVTLCMAYYCSCENTLSLKGTHQYFITSIGFGSGSSTKYIYIRISIVV